MLGNMVINPSSFEDTSEEISVLQFSFDSTSL